MLILRVAHLAPREYTRGDLWEIGGVRQYKIPRRVFTAG
jgi:hypothetical protein